MDDQDIYKTIAKLLWSILPGEAKEIKYFGRFYQNNSLNRFMIMFDDRISRHLI
ncbi:hypothetical protein PSAR109036_14470 [Psychrobacter arenosus]